MFYQILSIREFMRFSLENNICVWVLGLSISSGVRGVGMLHAVIMVIGSPFLSVILDQTESCHCHNYFTENQSKP